MPPRKKPDVPAEELAVVEETQELEELEDETGRDEDDDSDGPDEDSGVEKPCPEHYPHGWKGVPTHHDGVGCEHGSWTRPDAG